MPSEVQGNDIIANYGLYWERNMVNWWPGRRGRGISAIKLLGRKYAAGRNHDPDDQTDTVDFANQHGIYLLHKGFETVYVGQTTNDRNGLFQRLHMHCVEPGRGPLWDTFSWFGFKAVDPERKLSSVLTGKDERTVPVQTLIKVVETIVIQACLPRLNGQAGQHLGDAYLQVRDQELAASMQDAPGKSAE